VQRAAVTHHKLFARAADKLQYANASASETKRDKNFNASAKCLEIQYGPVTQQDRAAVS
jgi:hypothetical protein